MKIGGENYEGSDLWTQYVPIVVANSKSDRHTTGILRLVYGPAFCF